MLEQAYRQTFRAMCTKLSARVLNRLLPIRGKRHDEFVEMTKASNYSLDG